jgi:hypothetical protein
MLVERKIFVRIRLSYSYCAKCAAFAVSVGAITARSRDLGLFFNPFSLLQQC